MQKIEFDTVVSDKCVSNTCKLAVQKISDSISEIASVAIKPYQELHAVDRIMESVTERLSQSLSSLLEFQSTALSAYINKVNSIGAEITALIPDEYIRNFEKNQDIDQNFDRHIDQSIDNAISLVEEIETNPGETSEIRKQNRYNRITVIIAIISVLVQIAIHIDTRIQSQKQSDQEDESIQILSDKLGQVNDTVVDLTDALGYLTDRMVEIDSENPEIYQQEGLANDASSKPEG